MKNRTDEFYESIYWSEVRAIVKERDLQKCVICDTDYGLHVHHKNYDFKENEEHLNLDKLVTLCGNCHKAFHNSNTATRLRINTKVITVKNDERFGIIGMNLITNSELTAGEKVLLMYYSSFVNSKNGESTHLFRDKEVAKEMQTSMANIRRLKQGLSKKGYLLTIKQGYTQNYYYLIGKDAVNEYLAKKESK